MIRHGKCRRAFTLVELAICVTIIPIATFAVAQMIIALHSAGARADAHMTATEDSAHIAALWRADIQAARSVRITAEPPTMSIDRLDAEARPVTVKYSITRRGVIYRAQTGRPTERLSLAARSLRFSPEAGGFRVEWVSGFDDGVTQLGWPQTAFATPLARFEDAP